MRKVFHEAAIVCLGSGPAVVPAIPAANAAQILPRYYYFSLSAFARNIHNTGLMKICPS